MTREELTRKYPFTERMTSDDIKGMLLQFIMITLELGLGKPEDGKSKLEEFMRDVQAASKS